MFSGFGNAKFTGILPYIADQIVSKLDSGDTMTLFGLNCINTGAYAAMFLHVPLMDRCTALLSSPVTQASIRERLIPHSIANLRTIGYTNVGALQELRAACCARMLNLKGNVQLASITGMLVEYKAVEYLKKYGQWEVSEVSSPNDVTDVE